MVDPVYRTGTNVALCSDPAVEFTGDLDLLDLNSRKKKKQPDEV